MFKKWIKKLGILLLFLFLLLNIITAFHAYKFTHFYDDAAPLKKPEEMSGTEKFSAMFFGVNYPKKKNADSFLLPHKNVYLKNNDSLLIEAWESYNLPNQNRIFSKTVIMFHGHGGNKSGVLKEAEAFDSMGYRVFLVDFRAHGNSQGNICTIGFSETNDVLIAYNYIKQKYNEDIILWGISMGAATILKAVDEYNLKPIKIICEMPFATLQDAVKGRVRMMKLPEQPISTLLTFWGGTQQGFWAFDYKPKDYASKIKCPILLQWGKQDPRVSSKETYDIYNAINSKKQLIVYDSAAHQSLCKHDFEKWFTNVDSFLKN
ncbi:MAG: alpha/beta hydrolase [Chitinophagaceae bacterium]